MARATAVPDHGTDPVAEAGAGNAEALVRRNVHDLVIAGSAVPPVPRLVFVAVAAVLLRSGVILAVRGNALLGVHILDRELSDGGWCARDRESGPAGRCDGVAGQGGCRVSLGRHGRCQAEPAGQARGA